MRAPFYIATDPIQRNNPIKTVFSVKMGSFTDTSASGYRIWSGDGRNALKSACGTLEGARKQVMLPKRKATGGRRSFDYSIQPTLFSQYLLSSREIKTGRAKRSPGYVKMALLVLVLTFFGLP